MKNGVQIREAFELEEVWADALGIAFGEFAGGEWDWSRQGWREAKS